MKMNRLVTLVSILALCNIDITSASLFEDDFEGASSVNSAAFPGMGDFDPNAPAVGAWYMQEDQPEGAQVSSFNGSGQPTTAQSGDNYLIAGFHNSYYGNWDNRGWATANLDSSTDQASIDFWVWGHSGINGLVEGRELDYADGSLTFGLYFYSGGEVKFNAGGGLATLTATMTDDAWNHIVVDLDLIGDTADVAVNSQAVESFAATATETLGSIRFRDDNTGYYDDITVDVIPEPATIGLLVLSSGILWFRRALRA